MPTVSVLLPVYNAEKDLPRAIKSLQLQEFSDFEIIAIDDGSTDGSGTLLDIYAKDDNRIKVFHQPNAGELGKVLNYAAEMAKGKYLARQDADDASSNDRFLNQVRYLEGNIQTGLCGTWTWFIESELGPLFSHEVPDNHKIITSYLNNGLNPITHGSVMMRTDLFKNSGGYRGSFSEDLDLWVRLSEKTRIGMVTQVGYYYWRSIGGINTGAANRQKKLNQLILKLAHERKTIGYEATDWQSEYESIKNSNFSESEPSERQAAIHYSRALSLLRMGRWDEYREELQVSASSQGPYAQKAQRNLNFSWAAPLISLAYKIMEIREPFFYSRQLKTGTTLPDFLRADKQVDEQVSK